MYWRALFRHHRFPAGIIRALSEGSSPQNVTLSQAAHVLFSFLAREAALVNALDSTAEKIMQECCTCVNMLLIIEATWQREPWIAWCAVQFNTVATRPVSIFGATFSRFWVRGVRDEQLE